VNADCIIYHAETAEAIARCHPVMSQLRLGLSPEDFLERVQRQRVQGYRLACLEAEERIRAVAGYRFLQCLAWGRFCYVDDLATAAEDRSRGFGRMLFDWLAARAQEAGCAELHLDSGVQRFDAHRFYLARRMAISCHHFALPLGGGAGP
jgi:GNAT superfamily N-acetyltransferase